MHKFEWENPYFDQEPRRVVIEVGQDASLTEVLEAFESYLKAVGYSFDGNIDIVPEYSFDDTDSGYNDDTDSGYNPQENFDEYGNYGENNPPVGDSPVFEKGYPSYDAVNSKKKLWDATPEEWNEAYKVTMNYNGKPVE